MFTQRLVDAFIYYVFHDHTSIPRTAASSQVRSGQPCHSLGPAHP